MNEEPFTGFTTHKISYGDQRRSYESCGHDNLGWIGFSGKMYCYDCSLIVDEKFHHRLCDGGRCEVLSCYEGEDGTHDTTGR